MQGCGELRPVGVVFHLCRIGLGIGQHLAVRSINVTRAPAHRLRSLFDDLLDIDRPAQLATREANISVFWRSELSISLRNMPSHAF